MSRLDNAIVRLHAAVRSIEAGAGGPDGLHAAREASLEAELSAVRERYAQLELTTDRVGTRLDQTIDRLKLILDA